MKGEYSKEKSSYFTSWFVCNKGTGVGGCWDFKTLRYRFSSINEPGSDGENVVYRMKTCQFDMG